MYLHFKFHRKWKNNAKVISKKTLVQGQGDKKKRQAVFFAITFVAI